MKQQIFISHAMQHSTAMALALKKWLSTVLGDNVIIWCSDEDLPLGKDNFQKIAEEITKSCACISIIDQYNYKRPWIIFELGMFHGQNKEVIPLLCGSITHQKLQSENYPINAYSAYLNDKGNYAKLAKDLNRFVMGDENRLLNATNQTIDNIFTQYNEIYPLELDKEMNDNQIFERSMHALFSNKE